MESGRTAHTAESGNDLNSTELAKMVVEGERSLDIESLHHDFAHAIDEAPILVNVSTKHVPSRPMVFPIGLVQDGQLFRQ